MPRLHTLRRFTSAVSLLLLSRIFLTPFLLYISLISVFRLTDGRARILPLFLSPMTSIHAGGRDDRHCERVSAPGGVP